MKCMDIKKAFFLIVLTVLFSKQAEAQTDFKKHEINYNISNTILIESVELGYKYFFSDNQAVGANILINDRPSYRSESGSNRFNTHGLQIHYNYFFGDYTPGTEFYIQPYAQYRFGNFKDYKNGFKDKVNMNSLSIGLGGGYIWSFSDSFIIGLHANLGRNFSSTVKDRFSAIEYNTGLLLGYRF